MKSICMTNVVFPCASFWLQEMQFYLVVTYCLTISLYLYLFGSLRASFLGGGGREGERVSTPKRACSQAICLGELAMLEVITVKRL